MLGLHNMLDGAQICLLFPMNNKSQNCCPLVHRYGDDKIFLASSAQPTRYGKNPQKNPTPNSNFRVKVLKVKL